MSWVRSDDDEAIHPKMLNVSVEAFGYHQAAKQWAARHLTNGFIPLAALGPAIYHTVTRDAAVRYAEILAQATDPSRPDSRPLWEVVDGGWQIHDYLVYNLSRRQVLVARRNTSRQRSEAGRRGNAKRWAEVSDSASETRSQTDRNRVATDSQPRRSRVATDSRPDRPEPVPLPLKNQETSSPGAPLGARPGKSHPVKEPDIRRVVKHWATRWEARTGEAPDIAWPKACGQIAGIVRRHGVDETCALLDGFFASQDDLILKSDYGLGTFASRINKLKIERRRGGAAPSYSARTLQTLNAAREFIGGHLDGAHLVASADRASDRLGLGEPNGEGRVFAGAGRARGSPGPQ